MVKAQDFHIHAVAQAVKRVVESGSGIFSLGTLTDAVKRNDTDLMDSQQKERVKEIFMDEKDRRHRQNLLNFGLDTPVSEPPPGINK